MKEVSQELFAFLTSLSVFTDVMGAKLFPIAAPSDTQFPFATYRIREQSGLTKDGKSYVLALALHFKDNDYDACVELLDALTPVISDKYSWVSSEPDIDEQDLHIAGFINFLINK